ncbi:hypothetical protein GFK82_00092 [Candidatus Steffania adelgidicola]|nr:hypothetical protein GFK82_00092 [Candidatus Steffania adelgidicola]
MPYRNRSDKIFLTRKSMLDLLSQHILPLFSSFFQVFTKRHHRHTKIYLT